MARTYDVKGTNDFLIAAVLLFGLGIWAIRDGWFPPPSKLDKYPQRVPIHFEVEGMVDEILVSPNQEVNSGDILARLDDSAIRRKANAAEAELSAAAGEERENLIRLRRNLESIQESLAHHTLRAPTGGVLRTVHISPRTEVTPEDKAVTLDPRHHFYPFNKSLAVISLIGAIGCLVVHVKVR